jgi:4'-phosphopantetheinyl transferase
MTIKIHNRYLDNVTWAGALGCDYQLNNAVDIWRIGISSNLTHLNRFSSVMNTDELARSKRYLQLKDRNRFIISRGALRTILGRYLNLRPSSIEFGLHQNKKPYIKNTSNTPPFYNVSHSGDWIVIAVSDSEIGVDTELVEQSFDFRDIIKDYFSLGEISYINENEAPCEGFFKLWTRKEALTKATGKGLDDDLKFVPGLDGDHFVEAGILQSVNNWVVSSFRLNEKYMASIAAGTQTAAISFWDILF